MAIVLGRKENTTRADQLRRKRRKAAARNNPEWRSHPAAARPAAPQPRWEIRPRGPAARAQRMYSIPLAERGAEVQLPAVTISFSPRSLAVLLAGLACAGLLFLLTSPNFQVRSAQIEGLRHLSPDGVFSASGLQGGNLFLISPAAAEAEILRKIPAVRRASVSVEVNGEVTVRILEREPILLWIQENASFWVDAEGVFFPALAERSDLVRLEVREQGLAIALDGAADIDPQVVVQALELTVALPSGTRLIYDVRHGLGMMDPGGWMVYFGTSGQIVRKLDAYRRLVDSLTARGIRPGMVSVENLRQPFYRR
ncbi:MAG: FtsQ-type POTRA domain-containing protein [Anaerolineales bacterium]|nr:FtsQ-type POTRA domain-containing protein [Anaerolineales bacterium]